MEENSYKTKKKGRKNIFSAIPPISKYNSRKEWESECWKNIVKDKISLQSFITSYECHNIIMRVAVSQMINSGKSYKEIGNELWISPQTISGIVKSINRDKYQSYREESNGKQVKSQVSSVPNRQIKRRRVRTKFGTTYVSY